MHYVEKSAPPPGGEPDEFVLSDASVDRMGDVIEAKGWQLDRIKTDPLVLFNHDRKQIGRWTDVRVKGEQLVGRIVWADSDHWPKGNTSATWCAGASAHGVGRVPAAGARAADQGRRQGFRAVPVHQIRTAGMFAGVGAGESECHGDRQGLPRDLIAEVFRKSAPNT